MATYLLCRRNDFRRLSVALQTRREDRRALPERRLRQGLPAGIKRWTRRQSPRDDCQGTDLSGHRSNDRLADRRLEGFRRDRLLQRDNGKVRGSGDPEKRRDRMEAAAYHQLNFIRGRVRARAGRTRQIRGPDYRSVRQGPDRSTIQG